MKVELKDAKVELEVGDGKANLHINGHCIELPRVVGIRLIFGDDITIMKETSPSPPKVAASPTKDEVRRGCQSASSKRKLSASLKKYHAKKRRKEKLAATSKVVKASPTKKPGLVKTTGRQHLNGAGTHHVN